MSLCLSPFISSNSDSAISDSVSILVELSPESDESKEVLTTPSSGGNDTKVLLKVVESYSGWVGRGEFLADLEIWRGGETVLASQEPT